MQPTKSGLNLGPRIALIHALRESIEPINRAFDEFWPEAQIANVLDDSLSADRARGVAANELQLRFLELTRYALMRRPTGVLFTCSAFGPMIEACRRAYPAIPILKPNEAMIEEAGASARRVALLATFAPTLDTMPAEFAQLAPQVSVAPFLIEGALQALQRGDEAEHDRLAVSLAENLRGFDAIALAQFSLARAAGALRAATGLPVLTTPESAIAKLKRLVSAGAA